MHDFSVTAASEAALRNSKAPVTIAWQPETAIGINLVFNGSFEENLNGWDVIGGIGARVDSWSHSGDWSLRLASDGTDVASLVPAGVSAVTTGTRYVLTAVVKVVNAEHGVTLFAYDQSTATYVFAFAEATTEPQMLSLAFTADTAVLPYAFLIIMNDASADAVAFIDSVMLTPETYNPAGWGVEFFNGDLITAKSEGTVGMRRSWQGVPTAVAPWTEQRRSHIPDPLFTNGSYLDTITGVTKSISDGQLFLVPTGSGSNGVKTSTSRRVAVPSGKTSVTISATRQLGAAITSATVGGRMQVTFYDTSGSAVGTVTTPLGTNAAGVARMSQTGSVPAGAVAMDVAFYAGEAADQVTVWSLPLIEFVNTLGDFFSGASAPDGLIRYRYDGTMSVMELGTLAYAGGENASPSFLHVTTGPASMNSTATIPVKGSRADEIALYPLVPGVHESHAVIDGPTSGATGKQYEITGYSTVYGDPRRAVPEQARGIEVVYPDAPSTVAVRKGVLSLGHSASSTPVPQGWNCTSRLLLESPVTPKRFRIHFKNHDYLQDTLGSGTVSIHSTWLGKAEIGADGAATGAFAEPPVRVAEDNVFSVDGADGVTDWILPEQFALERGTRYLLSYGVNYWTAGTLSVGNSAGWLGGTLLDAGNPGVVGSKIWPVFDVWVEYEHIGTQPTLAVIGHSLNGAGNVAPAAHPWDGEFQAWHQLWALRVGGQVLNLNIGGSWTSHFADASPKWNFFDGTGATPDMLALYACSSDIAGGVPVADVKASVARLIAKAKAKWGAGLKILLFTEPGRAALDGNLATQAAMSEYNAWVRTRPPGVDYVVDTGPLLSDPDNPSRLRPDLSADGEHYTLEGHRIIARQITDIRGLPARYAPPTARAGLLAPRTPHRLVITSTKPSFKVRLWNGADAGCLVVWDSVAIKQLT